CAGVGSKACRSAPTGTSASTRTCVPPTSDTKSASTALVVITRIGSAPATETANSTASRQNSRWGSLLMGMLGVADKNDVVCFGTLLDVVGAGELRPGLLLDRRENPRAPA